MNEPERLYLDTEVIHPAGRRKVSIYRTSDTDIEYVCTDAFIEKVAECIREFNNHYYIMRYSDSCEPPLSEVTEWFENYMKEE